MALNHTRDGLNPFFEFSTPFPGILMEHTSSTLSLQVFGMNPQAFPSPRNPRQLFGKSWPCLVYVPIRIRASRCSLRPGVDFSRIDIVANAEVNATWTAGHRPLLAVARVPEARNGPLGGGNAEDWECQSVLVGEALSTLDRSEIGSQIQQAWMKPQCNEGG